MVNVTLSYASFTVESSALPENSIEHLLRLGFSTAIKNSIAGVKAGVLGNSANPWSDQDIAAECERLAITGGGRDERTAKIICDALQSEMFESIVSGKTRTPRTSAARISPDDKLRREIAIELLDKLAKDQGKVLPKRSKPDEKAAFDALLAKAMSSTKVMDNGMTFPQSVDKEFSDRKKRAAKIGSVDLDDLLS